MTERITLIVPVWSGRRFSLHLPLDVARWLHASSTTRWASPARSRVGCAD